MTVELASCSMAHLERLIEGGDAFLEAYGLQVVDGYLPFAGALQHMLTQMQSLQVWHPWLPYQFLFRPDQALVGLGGFKSVPSLRTVEIGYSVAPSYQNRGFATAAASQLIQIAFGSGLVDSVCAHTLAEPNVSTIVLQKCGMIKVAEIVVPDIGNLWKWEIRAV